jgi:hypothetical protein
MVGINNAKFRRYVCLLIFLSIIFIVSYHNQIVSQHTSVNRYFNGINSSSDLIEEKSDPVNVFIDLGANKGDSIFNFVGMNKRAQGGNINSETFPQSFKSAKWIIYGFEANSIFDEPLLKMKEEVEKLNHTVHLYKSTAAWTYDGTIDFYLDKINVKRNFWGSSLNKNHVI